MRAISLFSGVGMFDLGVSLAGFDIIAQVEIDDYCRRVLKRHAPEYWPDAAQFVDVREFGRRSVSGDVDLIYGGFPCQPHSLAGSRKGESDDRNLWPQFCRIISEIRPRAVMLENVAGITQAYTVAGEVRPAYALKIIADLTEMGYDARWGIISAADAGAPHQRDRWWCVAYASGERLAEPATGERAPRQYRKHPARKRGRRTVVHAIEPTNQSVGDSYGERCEKQHVSSIKSGQRFCCGKSDDTLENADGSKCETCGADGLGKTKQTRRFSCTSRGFRAQSRMGGAVNGVTKRMDAPRWPAHQGQLQHEWEAPRTVHKTAAQYRRARLCALGNGGIWTIAYQIAKGIKQEVTR